MAEEIVIKTTVDTKSAEAGTKNLKKELREAQREAQNLAAEFGEFDKRTQAAARRAGELRDQLDDVNDAVQSFKGGGVFEAGTRAAASMAGGIQAATGALSLFGVENENVSKALVQLQGAMALTQGLQALEDAPRAFKQLTTVITGSTVATKVNDVATKMATSTMGAFGVATTGTGAAFTALKGAIIATGIGALVVAIGYAVSKLVEFASKTEDAEEAQKKLNEEIDKTFDGINRTLGNRKLLTEAMKDGLEKDKELVRIAWSEALAEQSKAKQKGEITDKEFNERQIALTAKRDKDLADLDKKYKKEEEERGNQRKKKLKDLKEQEEKERKEMSMTQLTQMLELERLMIEKMMDSSEKKKAILRQEFDADIEQRRLNGTLTDAYEKERKAKLEQDLKQVDIDAREEEYQRYKENEEKKTKAKQEADSSRKEAALQNLFGEGVQERLNYDDRLALIKDYHKQGTLTAKEAADAEKLINEERAKSNMSMIQAISAGIRALGGVIGENTEFGKAAGIASATMDTYVGATAALKTPGPMGFIQAATIILTGLQNVRRIMSVQVPRPPGGAGGGFSGSASMSISAPTAPPIVTQTALFQNQPIQTTSTGSNRVYVLENDIRATTNKVDVLQNRGRVG